ncbi:SDR family NAD(P)-dependent oxidoreductase [Sphingomonas sp. TDK1]|uniref:SDR family NAD(P)-dependent oxidoreductase n=1 Tax=Sphingomonas sp. TDK1 TaxID=453247 RepID=UPI0007D9F337|nr:SDR family NAD(P)-dependent oxidoreductase [Sphingomonas sp. TDK1]OAN67109.1 hypothetical protein A7X12_00305 [Sphingomonas sp. TDK1]
MDSSETKLIVITGANRGLGLECARALVQCTSCRIVLACRDVEQGARAAAGLATVGLASRLLVRELDLASFQSIHRFVDRLLGETSIGEVRALVCNAGVQHAERGAARTVDGFEETFGVNFLGHFLLQRLLLPHLARPGRIVWVASGTHDPAQNTGMPAPRYTSAMELADPPKWEQGGAMTAALRRYTTSKLCIVYGVYELARRLKAAGVLDVTVNAMDPGMMPGTALARHYPMPMRLAWSYLLPALRLFMRNVHSTRASGRHLAALAADETFAAVSGVYFEGVRPIRSSNLSYDRDNARDLWETACRLAGIPVDIGLQH